MTRHSAGQGLLRLAHPLRVMAARPRLALSVAVLALVLVSALMCLAAIVFELGVVKNLHGELKFAHTALAAMTIFTSWSFTQVMFAMHSRTTTNRTTCAVWPWAWSFLVGRRPTMGTFCISLL